MYRTLAIVDPADREPAPDCRGLHAPEMHALLSAGARLRMCIIEASVEKNSIKFVGEVYPKQDSIIIGTVLTLWSSMERTNTFEPIYCTANTDRFRNTHIITFTPGFWRFVGDL